MNSDKNMKFKQFLVVVALLAIYMDLCFAQWSTDPSQNTPICTAPNNQFAPHIVVDDKGNSIIVWEDETDPTGFRHIYAQRLNRYGYKMWDERGVPVCTAREYKKIADVVSDGQSGAIIVWLDYENWFHPEPIEETDIYAQRIDSSGVLLWDPNGVAVCTAERNQYDPKAVSDNNGGAFVVWDDHRFGWGGVYTQKINEFGQIMWEINGIKVNIEKVYQPHPNAISDGHTGMIFTYGNKAQYVNIEGTFMWPIDSVVCNNKGLLNKKVISDDIEGLIIVGSAFTSPNYFDIRIQRLNNLGQILWSDNGVVVSEIADYYSRPEIVTDIQNGAIITWDTIEAGRDSFKLFIATINSSGHVLWLKKLKDLDLYRSTITGSNLVGDNKGGAIFKFTKYLNDTLQYQYIQKVDKNRNFIWGEPGIVFTTRINFWTLGSMVNDSYGGSIIVWTEFPHDIYAQQVSCNGNLGEVLTSVQNTKTEIKTKHLYLSQNNPNPFNSSTKISYQIPEGGDVSLKIFNLNGQLVKTLINQQRKEGYYEIIWNGMDDNNHPVTSGVYLIMLTLNKSRITQKITLLR